MRGYGDQTLPGTDGRSSASRGDAATRCVLEHTGGPSKVAGVRGPDASWNTHKDFKHSHGYGDQSRLGTHIRSSNSRVGTGTRRDLEHTKSSNSRVGTGARRVLEHM